MDSRSKGLRLTHIANRVEVLGNPLIPTVIGTWPNEYFTCGLNCLEMYPVFSLGIWNCYWKGWVPLSGSVDCQLKASMCMETKPAHATCTFSLYNSGVTSTCRKEKESKIGRTTKLRAIWLSAGFAWMYIFSFVSCNSYSARQWFCSCFTT